MKKFQTKSEKVRRKIWSILGLGSHFRKILLTKFPKPPFLQAIKCFDTNPIANIANPTHIPKITVAATLDSAKARIESSRFLCGNQLPNWMKKGCCSPYLSAVARDCSGLEPISLYEDP